MPTGDGGAGQIIQTDGSGSLSWTAQTAPGGTTGQLQFNSAGTFGADTELFWNNSSKRLGVGTASPASAVDVSGTVRATAFYLTGLGRYLNPDEVNTNYWAESDGDIYRETGNIGMGNDDPLEALDIDGRIRLRQVTAPADTADRLYNTSGDLYWNGLGAGGKLWNRTGNNAVFNLSGNVGIGATPTTKLEVAGTVKATNFYDATNSAYLVPGSINGNYWGESGGDIYRETGNVGIGNNSPGTRLDVSGSIRTDNQLISTLAVGTAPLAVTSTTRVANLNADLLDGRHETAFALLAGRAGGQTLIGGTAVTDILKLQGTSGDGTATSTAIQLLTGNNGAIVASAFDNVGRMVNTASLIQASGNEAAYTLNYTTNKAAGNDTGLLINMLDTASPGTSLLIDAQGGGVSKFSVDYTGKIILGSTSGNNLWTNGTTIGFSSGGGTNFQVFQLSGGTKSVSGYGFII